MKIKKALIPLAVIVGLSSPTKAIAQDEEYLEEEITYADFLRDSITGFGLRANYMPSRNSNSFSEISIETVLGLDWYGGLGIAPVPFTHNFTDKNYGKVKNSMTSANLKILKNIDPRNSDFLAGCEIGIAREKISGNNVDETRYPLSLSLVADHRITGNAYLSGRAGIVGARRWLREFDGNGYDGTFDNLVLGIGLNYRIF